MAKPSKKPNKKFNTRLHSSALNLSPSGKSQTLNHRRLRIAAQIQADLAQLIRDECQDPRIQFVTIQSVELSVDYAHAKVYVTTLAPDHEAVVAGLNDAAGFLHQFLFKRLSIHTIPRLRFQYDQTIVHAQKMMKLIAAANETNTTQADDLPAIDQDQDQNQD